MTRLTYWNEEYGCWSYRGPSGDAAVRLAAIENILGDEYDLDHLRELAQAENDGWLVVLPCKVGDTVWVVFGDSARKAVYKTRVQGISITTRSTAILNFGGYPVQYAWASEVGKTVFLTCEEAAAALSAQKGDVPHEA